MGTDFTIDLDAARAARSEARPKESPKSVKFGGKDYSLPPELPYDFAHFSAFGDLKSALKVLLGEQFTAFWENKPTVEDMEALNDHLGKVYGKSKGESNASADS